MSTRNDGFALVATLLVLLLIEAAVAGMLIVSANEVTVARLHVQSVRARLAAQSAVRATVADWPSGWADTIPRGVASAVPLSRPPLPDGAVPSATVERVAAGFWVVRGVGGVGASGALRAEAASGAIVRGIARDELWRDFAAAITTGAGLDLEPGATVDGLSTTPPPGWSGVACVPATIDLLAALPGLARPAIVAAPAASVDTTAGSLAGAPNVRVTAARTDTTSFASLGSFALADVLARADRIETGAVAPSPVSGGGTCVGAAAANWGAPLDISHPCADWFPLIHAPRDLRMSGGAGQGFLVVEGDLTLDTGAVFYGAVLVTGRLVAPDATIRGAVRILGGPAPSLVGGTITYDACALWRAFTGSRAFAGVYRPPGRWWIPAF